MSMKTEFGALLNENAEISLSNEEDVFDLFEEKFPIIAAKIANKLAFLAASQVLEVYARHFPEDPRLFVIFNSLSKYKKLDKNDDKVFADLRELSSQAQKLYCSLPLTKDSDARSSAYTVHRLAVTLFNPDKRAFRIAASVVRSSMETVLSLSADIPYQERKNELRGFYLKKLMTLVKNERINDFKKSMEQWPTWRRLPTCDNYGVPTEEMPECPLCGQDEVYFFGHVIQCYICDFQVTRDEYESLSKIQGTNPGPVVFNEVGLTEEDK